MVVERGEPAGRPTSMGVLTDRLRTLRPLIPALLALHGALLLATVDQQAVGAWLPVVMVAGIALAGAIAQRAGGERRGHDRLALGALLIAGTWFTAATPASDGGGWIWLLVLSATCPLLLRWRQGALVVALTVVGTAVGLSAVAVDVVETVSRAGAVLVAGTLATLLGRTIDASQAVQAALTARERRLAHVVTAGNDPIIITDAEHRLSLITPAFERVLGYRPADLLARRLIDLAHPDDRVRYATRSAEIFAQQGSTVADEVRLRHRDGSWRWIEIRATNLLDDPEVRGVVSSLRDVTDRHLAIDALRRSEEQFRTLASASPIGIFHIDPEGRALYVNDRLRAILGPSPTGRPRHWSELVHPDDLHTVADALQTRAGHPASGRIRLRRGAEERWVEVHTAPILRWVEVHTAPILDERGAEIGRVGTVDDITEEVARLAHTERLSAIIEATTDLVSITDADGRPIYLNAAARRHVGLADDAGPEALEAIDPSKWYPTWAWERIQHEALPAVRAGEVWSGELAMRARDGSEVPISHVLIGQRDGHGRLAHLASISRDMRERKEFEHRLAHQATHDPLTDLPNRALLLDRLRGAMARADRHPQPLAVLFCDLDNFKVVNDSLGHDVGDQLLVRVAERLAAVVRPQDTVARFGGDEFVVMCEQLASEDDAVKIAQRILDVLTDPVETRTAEHVVSTSIGIAFYRRTHDRPEAVIRDADAAMYRAKERGRNRIEVFDDEMRTRVVQRLDTERALRRALDRRELRLHYQPVIDLDAGRLVGFEALLRWEHPERGLLHPGEFISLAEETGLIVPIGAWTLHQACRQLQRWRAAHPEVGPLTMSVNLSGHQVLRGDVVGAVGEALADTGLDPGALALEMTETVLMEDAEDAVVLLRRLKDLGVRLAVDDFGTGYSSLAYLRRFPVDILKVDRAFVDGLGKDPEDSEVVRLVVSLARMLGLAAVAEGVETEAQLAELRRLGCHQAQGYRIARPLPASTIDDLLDAVPGFPVAAPVLSGPALG